MTSFVQVDKYMTIRFNQLVKTIRDAAKLWVLDDLQGAC